jgi:hypothetical protein
MSLGISMLKNIFLLQLKCEHMILVITRLNNMFPLHIKTQNYYVKYPNVLRYMS